MNILITGASKGIGYEIVKHYAKNGNNNIVAIARDVKSLQELKADSKNKIHIYSIDFLSDTFQDQFKELIKSHSCHFDVVINNAGYLINKQFSTVTNTEIQEVYQVNVYAPIYIMQKIITNLDSNKGCHIINIGSMGGVQGSSKFSGLSIYSSSKAALANLTECLAEEYAEKNITINCLALGSVQTEMLNQAFPGYKAEVSAKDMADYIVDFAINGSKYYNGKIISVSKATP